MRRTQILLELEQYKVIVAIAEREKLSVSALIHEMLVAQLKQREQDLVTKRRLEALAIIEQHQQAILQRQSGQPLQFDVVAMLEQIRDEHDEELVHCLSNSF